VFRTDAFRLQPFGVETKTLHMRAFVIDKFIQRRRINNQDVYSEGTHFESWPDYAPI
jgi:hypothetical protein